MNAWHEPTEDGRWPVPPTSEWPDDIRETVRLASQGAAVLADLTRVFQDSEEMRVLSSTYDLASSILMMIESSRKYTRYRFPNCPRLRIAVEQVLTRRGLQFNVEQAAYARDMQVMFSTVRIGAINETITYGAEAWHCPPSKN